MLSITVNAFTKIKSSGVFEIEATINNEPAVLTYNVRNDQILLTGGDIIVLSKTDLQLVKNYFIAILISTFRLGERYTV